MAAFPSIVSAASVAGNGNATAYTFGGFVVPAGLSNSLLVVETWRDQIGVASGKLSNITYGGNTLPAASFKLGGANLGWWIAALVAPTAGTASLVATFTDSSTGDFLAYVVDGAKQSGFPDSHTSTDPGGGAVNASVTGTTVATNCLVIDSAYGSSGAVSIPSVLLGQGIFANNGVGVGGNLFPSGDGGFSSYTSVAAAGAIQTKMSWSSTLGGANNTIYGNFSIAPAATTATTHLLTLVGSGK